MTDDPTTPISLADALAAHKAAERVLDSAKLAESDAIDAARIAIREKHSPLIAAAVTARNAAYIALSAAKDRELPDHPWTGKRVTKDVHRSKYGRSVFVETLTGIVETVRSGAKFPGNRSGCFLPRQGAAIVRILKKDGTTGLKYEDLRGDHHGWKLAEPEAGS